MRVLCSNGVADWELRKAGPYDLIVANILAAPLVALSQGLNACLATHGILILSGLLAQQENAGRNAYRQQGLALWRRIPCEGWHTLILAR